MAVLPFSYSIQFPGNGNSSEEQDDKNTFEIIHKSEAEDLAPVVVLLGWAGCKEKHLAKYSPIYEKKGYITVRVIVPTQTLFFQFYKVTSVAEGLLDVLREKGLASHAVVFHVFSNGGCMIYAHVSELVNTAESKYHDCLSVRGVIIDSAPGKRRILNAVKAFMATQESSAAVRYILGFCLLTYLFIFRVLLSWIPIELTCKGFGLFDRICEDPMTCPQLFVYSKCDRVILYYDVEEAAKRREQRGVTVKRLCWDDSEHVAHLRIHPEVYTHTCQDFAHTCFITPDVSLL